VASIPDSLAALRAAGAQADHSTESDANVEASN
jgi:hypothetical protein